MRDMEEYDEVMGGFDYPLKWVHGGMRIGYYLGFMHNARKMYCTMRQHQQCRPETPLAHDGEWVLLDQLVQQRNRERIEFDSLLEMLGGSFGDKEVMLERCCFADWYWNDLKNNPEVQHKERMAKMDFTQHDDEDAYDVEEMNLMQRVNQFVYYRTDLPDELVEMRTCFANLARGDTKTDSELDLLRECILRRVKELAAIDSLLRMLGLTDPVRAAERGFIHAEIELMEKNTQFIGEKA